MSNSLPTDATPEENARPDVITKQRIVLGLLVLAHALVGAYCTPNNETLAYITAGVRLSQPILLAIWAASAYQRFYYNLLWSLLLCTYLSFADDLGAVQMDKWMRYNRAMHGRPSETTVANLALFVVTLLIFLLVRRFSPWHITVPDEKKSQSAYLTSQHGIHHLLILTAIVGLALGLVRSLMQITDSGFPYRWVGEFAVSLGLLLVTVFPGSIVPWITLAKGHKRYDLSVKTYVLSVHTIVVAAALDFVAWWVMAPATSWYWFEQVTVPCFWMQVGAILSAVATTLVVRRCGFRMIQEPKKAITVTP